MSQPNKDIARIIDVIVLAFRSLDEPARRARKSLNKLARCYDAAFNPMNRYRWPGKGKRG